MPPGGLDGPPAPFVVLGNDEDALRWLEPIVASGRGILLRGVEYDVEQLSRRSGRVAFVLRDPVAMIADGEAEDARYGERLVPTLNRLGRRAIVVGGDELLNDAEVQRTVLDHLGLTPATPITAGHVNVAPAVSDVQRTLLFASVRSDVEELERACARTFLTWRFGGGEPASVSPARTPSVLHYVGRQRSAELVQDARVLTDWDVLPVALGPLLDDATGLTISDAMSFPFDAMRESDYAIPLAVDLPRGWTADQLTQLLGEPLLRHLTPHDRVAVEDDEVWRDLRQRYSWPMRLRVPAAALANVGAHLGDPSRALRARKGVHQALRDALTRQIDAARASLPRGERLSALLLGGGPDAWAGLFVLGRDEVTGIDLEPAQAARNFPEWSFRSQLPDRSSPGERVQIAMATNALAAHGAEGRRRRVAAMFRELRVGGRLVLLERFLEGRGGLSTPAPSPRELLDDVWEASARHVVLEHVEAIRLPEDDLTSVGVFAFVKLGTPERL